MYIHMTMTMYGHIYMCVHKYQQTLVNNNLQYNVCKTSYTTLREINGTNWNEKTRRFKAILIILK